MLISSNLHKFIEICTVDVTTGYKRKYHLLYRFFCLKPMLEMNLVLIYTDQSFNCCFCIGCIFYYRRSASSFGGYSCYYQRNGFLSIWFFDTIFSFFRNTGSKSWWVTYFKSCIAYLNLGYFCNGNVSTRGLSFWSPLCLENSFFLFKKLIKS